MKFINCARHPAEQNLALVQQDCCLYYQATRIITQGEELRVWYGDGYTLFLGIPLGINRVTPGELFEGFLKTFLGYNIFRSRLSGEFHTTRVRF